MMVKWFKNLAQNIGQDEIISTEGALREGLPKKSSCSFGFCPNEGGGGPCPNFLSTFHKLFILGQFWDGEGGGDPCPNFLAHWHSKKVVQVVQTRGRGARGGRGNFYKIQKNTYFFQETVPKATKRQKEKGNWRSL